MKCPSFGWIVGTLCGKPAYSDGHAMFLGEPPEGQEIGKRLTKGEMDTALAHLAVKNMPRVKRLKIIPPKGEQPALVMLHPDCYVQKIFYDYAVEKFPKSRFYMGKEHKAIGGVSAHAVIVLVGKDVVGVIQPLVPR